MPLGNAAMRKTPRKIKGLSPEDIELWAAYGRTLTSLMPGRAKPPEAAPPPLAVTPDPQPEAPPPRAKPGKPPTWLTVNATPSGLDKGTWSRFSAQKMRAEARLDLHGHTAARAHQEVSRFLQMSHATGLRCVEIITGNGEILARELPHWLNTPALRPLILALAHPHARNAGSIRVLLRRRRAREAT
ncbi:MAG: Smr/MutS family protein [Rhodospirillales bacterium]|nr:Smr/MutS family protein [Rhodospirillales bacterium]